jgi:hypothetical protein
MSEGEAGDTERRRSLKWKIKVEDAGRLWDSDEEDDKKYETCLTLAALKLFYFDLGLNYSRLEQSCVNERIRQGSPTLGLVCYCLCRFR